MLAWILLDVFDKVHVESDAVHERGILKGAPDSLPHLVALDAAQAIRLAVPRPDSTIWVKDA